ESVMNICADKKGHIYFTGEYRSSNLTIGTLLPPNIDSSPSTEIYVAKMDLNGNIVWNQTANSISGDYVYGICTDKQKNVLITGSFSEYYLHIDSSVFAGDHITNPNCTSGTGLFLIKFDSLGLFKWYQTISIAFDEVGLSVKTDKEDNIYVAAFARGDSLLIDTIMLYGLTNSASLLLKYNPNGHIIWHKKFGVGDHVGLENVAMDIDISNQGSLYMGSSFMKPTYTLDSINCTNTNTNMVFDPFIAKLGSLPNQSLGVEQVLDEHSFRIYPNPSSGNIHVLVNDNDISYNINIRNMQGQIIKSLSRLKGSVFIQLNDMPSGIYFIELSNQHWTKTSRVLIGK
ncbi:MAG TPA: T9SS type A sorting domain-containing protein, partial [Chitinophagaceae bacterium]|nr:T9SS type A sorting domain-containing protein [Chitinophagaceae bacterium]